MVKRSWLNFQIKEEKKQIEKKLSLFGKENLKLFLFCIEFQNK
jgi:hypothetical protein